MPAIFRDRRALTEDGVKLNVVEAGRPDGPALVLVHGLARA